MGLARSSASGPCHWHVTGSVFIAGSLQGSGRLGGEGSRGAPPPPLSQGRLPPPRIPPQPCLTGRSEQRGQQSLEGPGKRVGPNPVCVGKLSPEQLDDFAGGPQVTGRAGREFCFPTARPGLLAGRPFQGSPQGAKGSG